MKNLLLIIVSFLMISCDDSAILESQIKDLKTENENLKNLLKKKQEDKLVSSELILTPQLYYFKKGEKNTVTGIFYQHQDYPDFNLYFANEDLTPNKERKINYRFTKDKKIEFDYVPDSETEASVKVTAVFKDGTTEIMLYGFLDLPVK